MFKILILAANPDNTDRLRLDEEVRDIRECLERARHRDDFVILQRWAVRPRDLQRAMLEETPQIIHFSGHGAGEAGLYFEDNQGQSNLITGAALGDLFRLLAQKIDIHCVVLNGCYSEVQAKEIIKHVPYVIGMKQAIGDSAAIEFAVGFYGALGNRESVDFAFEAGKVAMGLNSTGSVEMPLLVTNENVSQPKKTENLGTPQPAIQGMEASVDSLGEVHNPNPLSEPTKLQPQLKKTLSSFGLPIAIAGLVLSGVYIYNLLHLDGQQQLEPLTITLSNGRVVELDDLKNHLKEGDFRNANEETGVLLFDIANLSGKTHFENGDSQKIDCQGLEEIDKLWEEFSNGKFGVKVQRSILADIQTWDRFVQKVEWENNGQTLEDRSELTYSLAAPRGHLPGVMFWITDTSNFYGGISCSY